MSAPVYLGPQALLRFARDRPLRRSYVSKYGAFPTLWSDSFGNIMEQELHALEGELSREIERIFERTLTRREAVLIMLRYGMIDGHEWSLEEISWYLDRIISQLMVTDPLYKNGHIDRTGQRFGRWTVVGYVGKSKSLCRCRCGARKEVRNSALVGGKSLGCRRCMQPRKKPGWEERKAKAEKARARETERSRWVQEALKAALAKPVADPLSPFERERLESQAEKEARLWELLNLLELQVPPEQNAEEVGRIFWGHVSACVVCRVNMLFLDEKARSHAYSLFVIDFAKQHCCPQAVEALVNAKV